MFFYGIESRQRKGWRCVRRSCLPMEGLCAQLGTSWPWQGKLPPKAAVGRARGNARCARCYSHAKLQSPLLAVLLRNSLYVWLGTDLLRRPACWLRQQFCCMLQLPCRCIVCWWCCCFLRPGDVVGHWRCVPSRWLSSGPRPRQLYWRYLLPRRATVRDHLAHNRDARAAQRATFSMRRQNALSGT